MSHVSDFTLSEFLAPLGWTTITLALALGLAMGVALRLTGHRFGWPHLFWQSAGGVVFFVPLALFRAFEGSDSWERFLATTVLWFVFTVGMNAGNRIYRRKGGT